MSQLRWFSSLSSSLLLLLLLLPSTTYATSEKDDNKTNNNDNDGTSIHFSHFVAHQNNQTCSSDKHARPFNNQIRGVNLGGWMVLEPWITPSLFYQFLGGDETSTAFDQYTFCEVLGAKEGNRQLRVHWETWVTEEIMAKLSKVVNSVRLPVGDWMYSPYGPYVGCTDGALEYVDQLLDWAQEYGISVLIDIHSMKGSQNGFDNSGQSMGFQWTSVLNTEPAGLVTFQHWPIRSAEWMGTFDITNISYPDINRENIQHSLGVIEKIAKRYSGHPAVLGLEPVNEPWQYTPIEELQKFYWDGYLIVKKYAPYWKYIMHDSFRFDTEIWGGFMAGCPDRALDTHIYQAWADPASRLFFYADACARKGDIAKMEAAFGPVIVGEWSLATDNCAMWLNGFNDNLPGFPRLPCKYMPCDTREAYHEHLINNATVLNPNTPLQGPYGTGMSGPIFNQCPTTRDWKKESSGDPKTGSDWIHAPPEALPHHDDTDNVMRNLARKKINAFSGIGHGFYFWNFQTELYEPSWSYLQALDRQWIPTDSVNFKNDPKIASACHAEDEGDFSCVVKSGQKEESVRNGLRYAIYQTGKNTSETDQQLEEATGDELIEWANEEFNAYWSSHRLDGVTCDFGGIATLDFKNRTGSDDDWVTDDDEYSPIIVVQGYSTAMVVIVVVAGIVLGSLAGFLLAMHCSPKFNKRIRHTMLGHVSNSAMRSSMALDKYEDYEPVNF